MKESLRDNRGCAMNSCPTDLISVSFFLFLNSRTFRLQSVMCVFTRTVFFTMVATRNRKFALGNDKPTFLLNRTLTFRKTLDLFGDPRLFTLDPRLLTLDF